jgi:hypothetical protein
MPFNARNSGPHSSSLYLQGHWMMPMIGMRTLKQFNQIQLQSLTVVGTCNATALGRSPNVSTNSMTQ